MNLESTEYGDNKGYCEDLTEGKFSFPVVHAVRASEDDRQILSECNNRFQSVGDGIYSVVVRQTFYRRGRRIIRLKRMQFVSCGNVRDRFDIPGGFYISCRNRFRQRYRSLGATSCWSRL